MSFRARAALLTLGLAGCDAVVGVDWDSYREATPPVERCSGGCAESASILSDAALDLEVRSAVGTTDGGLFVASATWIGKLCAAGKVAWSTSVSDAEVYDVAPDPDGGAYVVGAFDGAFAGLDAGGVRKGFLVRYGFDGEVVAARMFEGPIVAVATTSASSTHPVAVTALRPAGSALFTEGACQETAATTSGALVVLRLDASGACLARTDCTNLDPAVHPADARPATDLAFDAAGGLVFAGPYDGVVDGVSTCGSDSAPEAGGRGLVVARAPTSDNAFDPNFGQDRIAGWVDPPTSELFLAIHPSSGRVFLSGTTRASFEFSGDTAGAPQGQSSMFVLRFEAKGGPDHFYHVGGDTTGTSRGGGIAFDAEGNALVAGSVDGLVSWQNNTSLDGGAAGGRLVVTRIDASENEAPSFPDPSASGAVAPLLVERAAASGGACGVSLVTAFHGVVGLASAPVLAEGTSVLVAPGVGPTFFAAP